jgi:hypothetical protein
VSYWVRNECELSALVPIVVTAAPNLGAVIEIAEVGGLHHRYERRAA